MNFQDELVQEIVSIDKWPKIDRPEHIERLGQLADEADASQTIAGCLSAVLIRHQLLEEMTRILIRDAQFLVKIALSSYAEVNFKRVRGQMFGRLLDELNPGIDFPRKDKFLSSARAYNQIRIDFVHGLTKHSSLPEIVPQAADAKLHFESAKMSFEHAHQWFRQAFSDERNEIISSGAFPKYEHLRAEMIQKQLERRRALKANRFDSEGNQ
jgi:hypothetical protein